MSDVNASDNRIIHDLNDVIDTYQGAGAQSKAGIEVELAFFDPTLTEQKPMTVAQNKVLKNAALEALPGDWIRNEPTAETLEVNSIAGSPDQIRDVLDDINTKIKVISEKAEGIGLKRSYFQTLPHKTYEELLDNLMDVPRYQAFFGPPRTDMEGIAAYFSVCKSNQVSVSHKDPDHLLKNIRRLYFLAPFLFLLTDNSSGYREGQIFKGHDGMRYRSELGRRGGVPDYVFTAKTGEEYIEAHIDNVMNNPLYVHYNEKGELVRLPSGVWTSFNKLREKGLNTATNYYFSESVLWPDIKIAALKDENENVTGHRYEARMFGVGMHQHQTGFLITTALAFNDDYAAAIDGLLCDFGFDAWDMNKTMDNVEKAYRYAQNHNRKFFDIIYGRGKMLNFAKQFADITEQLLSGNGYDDELTPIIEIGRSGITDAHCAWKYMKSLDDVMEFQKTYDTSIFNNINRSAKTMFTARQKEKEQGGYSSASAQF